MEQCCRRLRVIVVVALCLAMLFPLLNDCLNLVAEQAPYGMRAAGAAVPLSRSALLTGAFQKRATERAKKESGYWKPLTLLGNQLLLWGFDQITAFHNGSVVMGAQGYLIQSMHLSGFNRQSPKFGQERVLQTRLAALKKLQVELAKRGTSLIVLIAPNVLEVYPEVVPLRYVQEGREKLPSLRERFAQMLRENGIVFVDSVAELQKLAPTYPFRLWAPTASHWNDVASCRIMQQVVAGMQVARLPKSFVAPVCDPWIMDYPPRDKDLDLLKIANLAIPSQLYEPTPYVDLTEYQPPEIRQRKSALLVGTSYLFAIAELLKKQQLASTYTHLFYYRQRRSMGQRGFSSFDKKKADWGELLSRDIVIIDAPVRDPSSIGYGFIEDALAALSAQASRKR